MDAHPSIEEAAEAAMLRSFTAQEIADFMEQPVELVMTAARKRAVHEVRPVDDVLRDWFRMLVL